MYPEVHEQETWEQRCGCIATMLCCRQQVTRRPDGKRPPLKNIAELTAGLLSHVDIDATDIAAAIVLTSSAQQRRRRLRIAKALMPVYRALREGQLGAAAARGSTSGRTIPSEFEETSFPQSAFAEQRDSDTEDGGEEESRQDNDWIPSDPELTRTLTMARAASAAIPLQSGTSVPQSMPSFATQFSLPVTAQEQQQQQQGASPEHPTTPQPTATTNSALSRGVYRPPSGRKVAFTLNERFPGKKYNEEHAFPSRAVSTGQLDLVKEERSGQEELKELPPSSFSSASPATSRVTSLDLTEGNLAAFDTVHKLQETAAGVGAEGKDDMTQAAASIVAEGVVSSEATPAQVMDQLAAAIQEEVENLGEGLEEAVLSIKQEESLDLATLELNPKEPTIWFKPPSSAAGSESGDLSGGRREEPLAGGASHEISSSEGEEVANMEARFKRSSGLSSQGSRVSIESSEAAAALAAVVEQAAMDKAESGVTSEKLGSLPEGAGIETHIPSDRCVSSSSITSVEERKGEKMTASDVLPSVPPSSVPLPLDESQPSTSSFAARVDSSIGSTSFYSATSANLSIADSASVHSATAVAQGGVTDSDGPPPPLRILKNFTTQTLAKLTV